MTTWTETSASGVLRTAREGGLERLQLHRPGALNALDLDLARELLAALRAAAADEGVRAIAIGGAGRAFCAGADVGGLADDDPREATRVILETVVNPIIIALRETPKPILAAVHGPAAGVGASIAAACDIVLVAESAYFLLAFANVGLGPDGGASLTVPARVGAGRATALAMLAERLPAADALACGLADRLVADADLEAEELAVGATLATGPTLSYAATKRGINAAVYPRLAEQLRLEARMQGDLAAGPDHAEGVAAFQERRKPSFRGVPAAEG